MVPVLLMFLSGRMGLLGWVSEGVVGRVVVVWFVPLGPVVTFPVLVGVLADLVLETFLGTFFLAACSSDLQDSPGKNLGGRVQVVLGLREGGVELVGIVTVVARPEGVDDRRTQFGNTGGRHRCRFHSIECCNIDLGGNHPAFHFHARWTMP